MSKGKLAKFAEMEQFANVLQFPYSVLNTDMPSIRGRWHEDYFRNNNPIVLELGCGRGEYTIGLARFYPDINFIGVDIKGARMWTGAKTALNENLHNVAFLRTNIEIIDRFFAPNEVTEIWLTFSDPQMKNPHKRLSSTFFLERYRRFMVEGGWINLKTDSNFLYLYTRSLLTHNQIEPAVAIADVHSSGIEDHFLSQILSIRTYYEQQWIDRGIAIKYLRFPLPKEKQLEESDEEIPFDEYRSYNRNRRTPKEAGK